MSTARLRDKTIVIIGGTSGLGLAAAEACHAEGASLVVVGRDPQKAQDAVARLGARTRAVTGDGADPQTARQAVQQAVETFGAIHGLYHVAGGSGRRAGDGPLDQLTAQGWQTTLEGNLTSLFHSNQAAVQQLLRQGQGGSILNMSSVLANAPSPRFFATHAYAAAKAGAIGLTRSCAAYYAAHNIRFNVIAPGLIETPMSQRAMQDDAILAYVCAKQPLDGGRVGQPEDANQAAVFFLSDDSRFVTGQVIAVDGGWTVTG